MAFRSRPEKCQRQHTHQPLGELPQSTGPRFVHGAEGALNTPAIESGIGETAGRACTDVLRALPGASLDLCTIQVKRRRLQASLHLEPVALKLRTTALFAQGD